MAVMRQLSVADYPWRCWQAPTCMFATRIWASAKRPQPRKSVSRQFQWCA
jgi:hypothetical protein